MLKRDKIAAWFRELQDEICSSLLKVDQGAFREDAWERAGGGGGRTRILSGGTVIERGGVNFSEVYGEAPEFLKEQGSTFYATGVSVVMHPVNPFVPIIHMNVRYFESGEKRSWFGGGIDLTPHYVNADDAKFFHERLKALCDRHQADYYEKFRKWADDYFFIKHRNETRGVGGIFFDHLGENEMATERHWEFVKDTGKLFAPLYAGLMSRNKDNRYSAKEKKWQHLRRGRYVEFNLVYDRGTRFGLETGGRTESILMSLPPAAQWEYDFEPAEGSEEMKTVRLLRKGIDWTGDDVR